MLPLHDWVFIRSNCNPFYRKHFNFYKMFNCDWWWNQAAKELLSKKWKKKYINKWKTLTHTSRNRNYGFSCSMEQERDIKRQKMMNNMHFIWVFSMFWILFDWNIYFSMHVCIHLTVVWVVSLSLSLYLSCAHFSMATFSFNWYSFMLSSTDLR